MAEGKIEIIENTLLKLLIRRGINADRLSVVFNEGELAYTTDTQRLYVGDGSTAGGILVTGTTFLGGASDITSLAPGAAGDLGFNTAEGKLYYVSTEPGSSLSHWTPVANLVYDKDGTISIDSDSGVRLGDCAGAGLTKDDNNKLTIADSIQTDQITKKTQPYLTLDQNTAFGNLNYQWPVNGSVNTFLRYNAGGALTWEAVGGTSTTFVNADIFPVGTIVPYGDSTLPANGRFLICDGSYVSTISYPQLSAVLRTTYGSLSTNGGTQYFKLPDLRGKNALGYTNTTAYDLSGRGLTFTLGSSGGEYLHKLEVNEFEHYHGTGSFRDPGNDDWAGIYRPWYQSAGYTARYVWGEAVFETRALSGGPYGTTTTNVLDLSGVNAHNNMQPYLAVNYIIKALPDPIAECQITIGDSLTASDSVHGTVFNINPLSGNYTIGLASQIQAQTTNGITVNSKGLVTSFVTTSAGDTGTVTATNTSIVHSSAYINFLDVPVDFISLSLMGTWPVNTQQQVNVYPSLSSSKFGNLATPVVSIPSDAKNIIIEAYTSGGQTNANDKTIYTALNNGLLGSGANRGTKERTVIRSWDLNSSQTIVPLSANENNNTLSFAARTYTESSDTEMTGTIIGWTL